MRPDAHTLVGAYVLNATDEVEAAAVRRHLDECPACAAEAGELTETAARLGDAASAPPPPALRERVLAVAARTPQVAALPTRHRLVRGAPATPVSRRWLVAAVAASLIAVAGTGSAYVIQDQRVRRQSVTIEAERARADADRQRAADKQRQVADVLAAPDARVVAGTPAGGGRVTTVVSPSLDRAVVVLSNLPDPGTTKAYQLWMIRGNAAPASAGVITTGAREATELVSGVQNATLAMTLEPAGGSAAPTPPIITRLPLR